MKQVEKALPLILHLFSLCFNTAAIYYLHLVSVFSVLAAELTDSGLTGFFCSRVTGPGSNQCSYLNVHYRNEDHKGHGEFG